MAGAEDWRGAAIDFWFSLPPERHWQNDPELDAEIKRRFAEVWRMEKVRPAAAFLERPEAALAAILLFDQFPRNMFREDPRSFASDKLARAIAVVGIDRGYDDQVASERRHFFYMPLEHSEAIGDQERSVALFERLGNERYLDYARKHHAVIARFGRFPHRNRLLGRPSTAEELAFGLETPW